MSKDTLQTVERAFLLLELLASRESMGVREIARETALSTTVVHRLLVTLTQLGYIAKDEETERYLLTYQLAALGERVASRNHVVRLTHKRLVSLAEACGETVHFVERVGTNIRYIDKVTPNSYFFATGSYIGLELPLAGTAVGKAILSELPTEEVRQIWAQSDNIQHTEFTICSLEPLLEELEEAKKTGFAYDRQERELGLFCIGVSIPDFKGAYRYGVSVSAPITRMTQERIEEVKTMLRGTRHEITQLIGKKGI